MNDLRKGATRVFLPTLEMEGKPRGRFLDSVREAAAGEFEILGELGRHDDGEIAYLARDLKQPRLVALRLELDPGSRHDYVLTVLQELEGSLPSTGAGCPRCSGPLRGWGRFCPKCGYDLSGVDPSGLPASGVEVEDLVGQLTGEDCQILGEMRRSEGGGLVYFAKRENEDTIVGLRLKKGEDAEFAVDRTVEITFLPDAVKPSAPSNAGDQSEGSLPAHMAPTLHADSLDVAKSEGRRKEPGRPIRSSRISPTLILLIVGAALIVGVVLGTLFG